MHYRESVTRSDQEIFEKIVFAVSLAKHYTKFRSVWQVVSNRCRHLFTQQMTTTFFTGSAAADQQSWSETLIKSYLFISCEKTSIQVRMAFSGYYVV